MNNLSFILSRLKEPGSIRSLVLTLFLLKGQAVDDALIDQIVTTILTLLGVVSFFMKPEAPHAAITEKTETLAQNVQSAVAEVQALTKTAQSALDLLKVRAG